ncbi:hypothetical protein KUTeg_000966 [Tegillarca granosa]|uniref:Dynactin subunit 6 n=1 Tax=Tegillarca granosa TaxID=220873 RepID=A0ABQ9FW75_TEGGR|nr:hypothetical protein KUTeg_000966 [Tegillarca granosa]
MSKAESRSSVKITPGAVVCDECELVGDITIEYYWFTGARTVIHPKARIVAEDGPIIIGENNIIEELEDIKTRKASRYDNCTLFTRGVHSDGKVGRNVELTSGCIVGAMCSVTSNEALTENSIIYGSECDRRIQRERPPAQGLQIDFLTKILPNYHYLKKPKAGTPQRAT